MASSFLATTALSTAVTFCLPPTTGSRSITMPVATDSYTSHATHSKQASLPVFPTDNVYDCVFDPSPELEAFLPWKTAQKREMIALTDGLTGVQYT